MTGPSFADVVARFTEHGIDHRSLRLHDGSQVVVSAYGGRIYGPFTDEGSGSDGWLPDSFSDADVFRSLVDSGEWNVGGERLWLGPEIALIIQDRRDYWGTFVVPDGIDPAPHFFDVASDASSDDAALIHREPAALRLFHQGTGEVYVKLSFSVEAVASPLATFADAGIAAGARFGGYVQRVTISHEGSDDALLESWNLAQVRGGGTALVPATGGLRVTDYYEPVGGLRADEGTLTTVAVTGSDRYKIGFAAAQTFGRIGYVRAVAQDEFALLIRQSRNDPTSPYGEEPDFLPGHRGDSMHVYNDDGGLGGFGELESRGIPTGASVGRRSSVDEFHSWWFHGTAAQIDAVALLLLGATHATAYGTRSR